MKVVKPITLMSFAEKHRDAQSALEDWLHKVKSAKWTCLDDTRAVFPHADEVKVASGCTVTIFNIKGTSYRLITAIHYNTLRVFIRDFMTHSEYSKNHWKERH